MTIKDYGMEMRTSTRWRLLGWGKAACWFAAISILASTATAQSDPWAWVLTVILCAVLGALSQRDENSAYLAGRRDEVHQTEMRRLSAQIDAMQTRALEMRASRQERLDA